MKYLILNRQAPELGAYTRFVRGHSSGHFLQDPAWADAKPGWQWQAVAACGDDGEILGAMSVLLRRLPMGLCVAYAPRGPVCDRADTAVVGTLLEGVKDLARRNRCILTYLDPDEPESNGEFSAYMRSQGFCLRHSDGFGGVQPQSVFRIDLRGKDEAALLASFAQKTRYNIRLAQRRGVTITRFPGSKPIAPEALDAFSDLMKTTGERDGFLVRGRDYFQRMLSALGDSAVLYLAQAQGKTLAGTIAVFYGGKAWYAYGASSNESRGSMPNYLLQWQMICDALEKQCVFYDFRGVPGTGEPTDPLYGLYRFKKGFGGVHTRFAGLFICYHKKFTGKAFDRGQNLFRKLRRKLRCKR